MTTEQKVMQGAFFFDPDDPIYADHFPGNPVVPGSMIIRAFILAAEACGMDVRSVRGFRFKRFVSPGEYPYRLEILGDEVKCALFDGASSVATGILAQ